MAKRLERFTRHEMQVTQESLQHMSSTCKHLIESVLNVIDEGEGTAAYKESLKANFLSYVVGVLFAEQRISSGLADSLQMVADDMRDKKNPAAGYVEALAHAMRARLKSR